MDGASWDPEVLSSGGNGGHQAVNLAALLTGRSGRIVLLGYDMQLTGGRSHHHGDHQGGLNNPREPKLAEWAQRFEALAASMAAAGIEVVNCSRETALTCFPRRPLDEVLAGWG